MTNDVYQKHIQYVKQDFASSTGGFTMANGRYYDLNGKHLSKEIAPLKYEVLA